MSRLSLVIVLLFLLIALVSPNKVNYNSIASKVAAERGPIFEFGEEVSQLLDSYTDANQDGPEGLFEARILFDDYISNLRDFYTEQFVKDFITVRNDHEQIALIKQRVLRECNSAMKAALPKSAPKDWSYESALVELLYDIDAHIEEADQQATKALTTPPTRSFRHSVWFRRLRWLGVQSLLFFINFAQNEWQRRAIKRAAEKRLAEVPEFPLL